MEQKPITEMNLRECNAEIEAAGGKALKRIDHARNLVNAIRNGKTTGAAAAAKSAKRAVKATRKNAAAATPGQPALTTEQAENTETTPDQGGKEAPVATKTAKKARKQGPKANRTSKGKSIIPDSYRSQYKKHKGIKTESGAPAVHCGDGLASAMAGLDNDGIAKVARENKVDLGRWSKLNPGQVRMNLGNVLRGMLRRGEKVTVAGKTAKL